MTTKRKVGIVYELRCNNGVVFYIGSTTRPGRRHADYKALRAHANERLLEKLQEGFGFFEVYRGTDYLNEEYKRINSTNGLVNILTKPNSFWKVKEKSSFGWYIRNYRNRFGVTPFLIDLSKRYKTASHMGRKAMDANFDKIRLSYGAS